MAVSSPSPAQVDKRPPFTLLGDQPEFGEDDPLNFEQVATDLASLILASRERTPFTIGIKGDWGAGKSSIMRRLDRRLEDHAEVVRVWFNAWTSERGDTLEGLIKSVLAELDPNILRKYARNKKLITGVRVLTTLAAGPLRVGNVVDALWERAALDPKARNQLRDIFEEAMNEWVKEVPEGAGKRVLVVFVDDLDRCSPDSVFQVFEAIKLYLDAKGFVFVVGFDETVVSEAILEQKKFSKSVTSQLYLDKIVQIEYAVPRLEEEAVRAFLDRLTAVSGTGKLVDDSARSLIVQGSDRNPRRLKRFINAFVLEHALDPNAAEVDPPTLIRELILRTYFQEFVRLYARGPDPLEEFTTYLRVRELGLASTLFADISHNDRERVARFLNDHRVPTPEVLGGEVLNALEQNLPEPYPGLATNENFVSLIKYLGANEGQDDVRSRLANAPEVTGATDAVTERSGRTRDSLGGLRILWVDDEPDGNEGIVAIFRNDGHEVDVVDTTEAAETRLRSGQPVHLLISDIGRSYSDEAGFDDLRRWRTDKLYEGPAIFFTSRVTPARREMARDLGATVKTNLGDLLQQVGTYESQAAVSALQSSAI
jgi:CheY-like chemotaxis protein